VRIQNQATAALYIYTPYRPNQAALNAGWGTGDSCSSYGNRNFYNFYTLWFGSTKAPSGLVDGPIAVYWRANQGWLGQPSAAATELNGGRTQQFKGGVVYEPHGGAVSGMSQSSPILAAFNAAGGTAGQWGWPVAPAVNQGGSGNTVMRFQHGTVVEAAGRGVFFVPNAFVPVWEASGGFHGSLGVPNGPVAAVAGNGGGQRLDFAGGSVFQSGFGAFALTPSTMLTEYTRAGGPAGAWGWPTGKASCTAGGAECSATFSRGVAVTTKLRGTLFTPYNAPADGAVKPGSGESVAGGVVQ
jgi:hypothetical protein